MRQSINGFLSILLWGMISCVYAQSMSMQINPNGFKEIANNSLWSVTATCKIQTKNNNQLKVRVFNNSGRINGKQLNSGQGTSLMVHNNQIISVSAEPGTKVDVYNLSHSKVQANCS